MAETSTDLCTVSIDLIHQPIPASITPTIEGAGAVVTFRGVVRPIEEGRPLRGLDYTSYEPMAQQQLRRLAQCAADKHELDCVQIMHSLGFVAIHEASLLVLVASKHRKAALQAIDEILDDLKRDVPIWKSPIFADRVEGDE